MSQAITTRYIGESATKPSRIKARSESGCSITLSRHTLSDANPHREAAEALCRKMNWTGHLVEGHCKNSDHVFVFAEESQGPNWWAIAEQLRAELSEARAVAALVLEWAKTPGPHGGNPYCLEFVKQSEMVMGKATK